MQLNSSSQSFKSTFFQNVTLGMLSMLGQSIFILADTYFISNGIGADGIAALNIILPVIGIINGLGWMVGVGGAALYSGAKGRGNPKKANEFFTYSFIFAGIIGVLFTLACIIFAEPILRFLGATGDIYTLSKEYYDIFTLFSLFFIMNNLFITFLRNDSNAKLAMIGFTTGGLFNIVLDYIFIYPLEMGMFGAATATIMSPIISLTILSFHRKYKNRTLKLTKIAREVKTAAQIASLGFSSFMNEFSSALVMFLFNIILLDLLGNVAVSAYAIIANMNIIAIAIFTGIGQGMQPVASINHGARSERNVKKTLKYTLITSGAVGSAIFVGGLLFSEQIVSIFNGDNNTELANIAVPGLKLYFSSFIFTGINFSVIYFMAAVQRFRSTLIVSMLRGFILVVPVLLVMMNIAGVTGVWLTMPIVELLTLGVSILLIKQYLKNFVRSSNSSINNDVA
ncbi:MAG: MATE family efflux transporter [Tetragenococcus koreensis]|nr:MATE family efflux transporter [Tetragenococcus koreensis]